MYRQHSTESQTQESQYIIPEEGTQPIIKTKHQKKEKKEKPQERGTSRPMEIKNVELEIKEIKDKKPKKVKAPVSAPLETPVKVEKTRKVNEWSVYVKHNYKKLAEANPSLKTAEIMKLVASQRKNINSK